MADETWFQLFLSESAFPVNMNTRQLLCFASGATTFSQMLEMLAKSDAMFTSVLKNFELLNLRAGSHACWRGYLMVESASYAASVTVTDHTEIVYSCLNVLCQSSQRVFIFIRNKKPQFLKCCQKTLFLLTLKRLYND